MRELKEWNTIYGPGFATLQDAEADQIALVFRVTLEHFVVQQLSSTTKLLLATTSPGCDVMHVKMDPLPSIMRFTTRHACDARLRMLQFSSRRTDPVCERQLTQAADDTSSPSPPAAYGGSLSLSLSPVPHLSSTAWEEVCRNYPEVGQNQDFLYGRKMFRGLESLPSVREIERNPVAGKTFLHLNMVRRGNIKAALIQSSGELQKGESSCEKCFYGHGPWKGCVKSPRVVTSNVFPPCANCLYNGAQGKCVSQSPRGQSSTSLRHQRQPDTFGQKLQMQHSMSTELGRQPDTFRQKLQTQHSRSTELGEIARYALQRSAISPDGHTTHDIPPREAGAHRLTHPPAQGSRLIDDEACTFTMRYALDDGGMMLYWRDASVTMAIRWSIAIRSIR